MRVCGLLSTVCKWYIRSRRNNDETRRVPTASESALLDAGERPTSAESNKCHKQLMQRPKQHTTSPSSHLHPHPRGQCHTWATGKSNQWTRKSKAQDERVCGVSTIECGLASSIPPSRSHDSGDPNALMHRTIIRTHLGHVTPRQEANMRRLDTSPLRDTQPTSRRIYIPTHLDKFAPRQRAKSNGATGI